MNERPKNAEGQEPTRTPEETVDRLEEKKHADMGGANRDRIEEQKEEVSGKAESERPSR